MEINVVIDTYQWLSLFFRLPNVFEIRNSIHKEQIAEYFFRFVPSTRHIYIVYNSIVHRIVLMIQHLSNLSKIW